MSKDVTALKHFQRHPWDWVQAMWGHNDDYKYSKQQEDYFTQLGKMISAKLDLSQGKKLKEEKKELAEKIGLSVMSGHGTGKDACVAQTILFFLYCFSHPKIPCTAPSAHQLKDVLWAEISKWIRKSRRIHPDEPQTVLGSLFEWQSEKVFYKEKKGKEWFAVARTVNSRASEDEQAETLAGFHEDFLLFVIDEAAGVVDPVFKPIEGSLTGKLNLVVMIFNPTRAKGYAIKSHSGDRSRWVTLRWNSEESEIVDSSYPKTMENKYGRDSNTYRIRVLGLPPTSDTDTLIPWDWIMDAVDRDIKVSDIDPVIKGLDVGAGGDKSVLLTRRNDVVERITRHNIKDTMELTGRASMEIDEDEAKACCVDVIGIGKGVYDRLREYKKGIYGVDVRRTPRNEERFSRLRDELWWKVREKFEQGVISIPNDQELIDQLGSVKYEIDSNGRVKIESKERMRKRGMSSPDEADALCLSYYVNDAMFRPQTSDDYDWDIEEEPQQRSWMTA